MSAFSAIKSNSEIFYIQNSSDEEGEVEQQPVLEQEQEEESELIDDSSSVPPIKYSNGSYKEPVFSSLQPKYGENILISENRDVYFGLESDETLILKGQYLLNILKGSLLISGIVYNSLNETLSISAPISHSLPELKVVETEEESLIDNEISKLPFKNVKTIIKISNNFTGLETIGFLCPIFKNIFHNNKHNQFSNFSYDQSKKFDLNFKDFSFYPIFKPIYDLNKVIIPNNWARVANSLISTNGDSVKKIMIIGYKNSGKTSLLKYLVNNYLKFKNYSINEAVGILDVDPGQSEFSTPNCLSYTLINDSRPLIGDSLTSNAGNFNEYYGFNSPMDNPEWYIQLIRKLYIQKYLNEDYDLQCPLLINMPGWIKGFGVQLINEIIEIVKPTDVIYLKGSNDDETDADNSEDDGNEDDELISKLKLNTSLFEKINLIKTPGYSINFNSLKYSSQELSTFKLLSFFHRDDKIYNFRPLLYSSPISVSYFHESSTSDILSFSGVSAITIFNDDELSIINEENIDTIVDCSIMGVYAIETNQFINLMNNFDHDKNSNIPVTIPFETFREEVSDLEFLGLTMIHSINLKQHSINLYSKEIETFKKVASSGDYKLILSRGRTSIPIWEIYPKAVGTKGMLFNNQRVPFVSHNEKFGKGGKILKTRRNIQRRRN